MDPKDLKNRSAEDASSPNPEAFAELKQIVEDELSDGKWDGYERIFEPVTDGLGLESPADEVEQVAAAKNESLGELFESEEKTSLKKKEQIGRIKDKVAAFSAAVDPEKEEEKIPVELEVLPPPGQSPSILRRVMAGVIDQAFVGTLWLIAMVITLKVMTGSFVGGEESSAVLIGETRFLQFAVLEFAAVWLAYLIFCIGLLDMTFGMWVWGIRVGYMTKSKKTWVWKKVLRTAFTFLFYAPVLPLALLVFKGKKQRNLLDRLSGTVVYQSV